jgi:hypothetical protein
MASDGPKTARRRPAPPRALLVAAALVGTACGLTFAVFGPSDADPTPATADERLAALHAARPAGDALVPVGGEESAAKTGAAEPVTTATVIGTASTGFGGHAGRLAMRKLGQSLAAARADGGSPVAAVRSRTALRAAPGGRVVERLGTETEFGSPRVHAVVRRKREWLEVRAAELPNGETGWINAFDADIEAIDHAVHTSLGERALTVRLHGRVVRRVEVAVGGSGTPTPTGTFAVTDKLRMREESAAYGCCILALTGHQPRIPQGWSGGDRLAVHGTPDETTVGEAASLGCFRADDADMRWLIHEVPLGTPVTVTR